MNTTVSPHDTIIDGRCIDLKIVTLFGTVVDMKRVPAATTAAVVAQSVAARLNLPQDAPFALRRDDSTAEYLQDDQQIGDVSLGQQERLALVPKAHLG